MFLDIQLLYAQNNGILGIAWRAATRGVTTLNKKNIIGYDVAAACDNIMKYVQSNSTSPQKRFSLRLSAYLINGLIKIYNQMLIIMEDDIYKIRMTVKTPFILRAKSMDELAFFKSPETPQVVVKKKKTKKAKTDFQQEINQLMKNVQECNTMEEHESLQRQEFPQELGDFDLEIQAIQAIRDKSVSELLATDLQLEVSQKNGSQTLSIPPIEPVTFVEIAQVHAEASGVSRIKAIDVALPSEVMMDNTGAELERAKRPESVPEIALYSETILEQPRIAEHPEAVADHPEITSLKSNDTVKKIKKKTEHLHPENFININRQMHYTPINRCYLNDLFTNQIYVEDFRPKISVNVDLAFDTTGFVTWQPEELEEIGRIEPDSASKIRSLEMQTPESRHPIRSLEKTKDGESIDKIQTPRQSISLLGTKSILSIGTTPELQKIDEISHLEQITVLQDSFKKPSVLTSEDQKISEAREIPIIHESLEQEIPVDVLQEVAEQIPVPSEKIIRYQRIVDIVKEWKYDEGKVLGLEDVAEKPLIKLNVARAFGDVLVLSKGGYINLISEEGSLQLKCIEKGRKLLDH